MQPRCHVLLGEAVSTPSQPPPLVYFTLGTPRQGLHRPVGSPLLMVVSGWALHYVAHGYSPVLGVSVMAVWRARGNGLVWARLTSTGSAVSG